jgi:hypothetical protein
MKWYKTKMQTALGLVDAIALLKIYGTDIFTQINHLDRDLNLITKNIQPHFNKENRVRLFINELKRLEKGSTNSTFEFIIK